MKTATITFRTTPELKQAIKDAAPKSIGDYIHDVLQNHLNVRQMASIQPEKKENVRHHKTDVRQPITPPDKSAISNRIAEMVKAQEKKPKATLITKFGSKQA